MLANADVTVFEKDTFLKHTINKIYWNDSRGQTMSKNGVQIADSVIVYLYSDEYIPKAGDILVLGNCNFIFDTSSQKSASESMRKFRETVPGFAVVKSVNNCMFGGLPHIELVAR
ncbi:MAG: DUF6751 family protein [Oscillospiraceae bacterium]